MPNCIGQCRITLKPSIMKAKFLSLLLFCGFAFFLSPSQGHSATVIPATAQSVSTDDCTSTLFAPIKTSDLVGMSRKEVEVQLGRKLPLKERLTLKLVKRYDKRMTKLGLVENDCSFLERKANEALLFGLLGLLIAGIIFGILAITAGSKAKRLAAEHPDCPDAERKGKKGNTGIILGIIDIIGAIVVIAILL